MGKRPASGYQTYNQEQATAFIRLSASVIGVTTILLIRFYTQVAENPVPL